jgi:hypothetical protein
MRKSLSIILLVLSTIRLISAQGNDELLKPERVYLHTDRDLYLAGEYLFYTLYLQGNPGQMSKYAYLIIRDKNSSFVSDLRLEINNQIAYGSIYLSDTLSSGIYQIVCYTNCMRNEGEKTYFNKEIIIANRFDEKMDLFNGPVNNVSNISSVVPSDLNNLNENIIIHLDKQVFDQREKISFAVENKNNPKDSITRLSVSISEIIPGIPPGPSIPEYFESNRHSNYSESNQNHCRFIREINDPVIQGQVVPGKQIINEKDSKIISGTTSSKNFTLLVSTIDSIVNMQFIKTDSTGRFSFLLNPYYDGKEVIVRLKENVNSAIVPDEKFSLFQMFTPSGKFNVPGLKDYIIRNAKIAQFQNFYSNQTSILIRKSFLPSKTVPRIYYKQYSTISPSDFLELPDFIEISKEIVPALRLRKTDDKYVSTYVNLLNQSSINAEPTIFLDGVPIDDVNQIINMGSARIERIESLPVPRAYGELSFSGVLAIFSKDREINNIQFKTPTIKYQTLSSESYTKPEAFKPVDNSKHIPDLRQQLLWEPEIILGKNEKRQISCYASDLQGKFRINIQGITSDGNPVSGSAIFSVQFKER